MNGSQFHLTVKRTDGRERFRLFGKHSRWSMSIIWKWWKSRNFTWAETETDDLKRFNLFGKRLGRSVSIILEYRLVRNFTWPENRTTGWERFRLFGKCCRCSALIILGIMRGSQFHLAKKNGTIGQETISLMWKTPSMLGFGNFGNSDSVAISLDRKTEQLAGKWFRLFGNAVDV